MASVPTKFELERNSGSIKFSVAVYDEMSEQQLAARLSEVFGQPADAFRYSVSEGAVCGLDLVVQQCRAALADRYDVDKLQYHAAVKLAPAGTEAAIQEDHTTLPGEKLHRTYPGKRVQQPWHAAAKIYFATYMPHDDRPDSDTFGDYLRVCHCSRFPSTMSLRQDVIVITPSSMSCAVYARATQELAP